MTTSWALVGLSLCEVALPAAIFLHGLEATAGDREYHCVIAHVYELGKDGMLDSSTWNRDFSGKAFVVSRDTGQIDGPVLTTWLADSVSVIHFGNNEWSFRAAAEFEGSHQLIDIQEFHPKRKKPFVASSMGGAGIVTGTCE